VGQRRRDGTDLEVLAPADADVSVGAASESPLETTCGQRRRGKGALFAIAIVVVVAAAASVAAFHFHGQASDLRHQLANARAQATRAQDDHPASVCGPGGCRQVPDTIAPTNAQSNEACPPEVPLPEGEDAQAHAVAATVASLPVNDSTKGVEITRAYPARSNELFGSLAYGICGSVVGDRTWVVEMTFPALANVGASVSQGQAFVSRFPEG
jgi:hypothetical protein